MPNIQTFYFEIHLKCCHLLWRLVELLKKAKKNLFWPWLQLKEGSESRSIRSGFSRTFFVLTFITFIWKIQLILNLLHETIHRICVRKSRGRFPHPFGKLITFSRVFFFATWWSLGVVFHLVWKSWRDSLFHQCWSMWWFKIFEHTQRQGNYLIFYRSIKLVLSLSRAKGPYLLTWLLRFLICNIWNDT